MLYRKKKVPPTSKTQSAGPPHSYLLKRSVPHATGCTQCRQCSRQYTDNKLQNHLPSLLLHRLKIKFIFFGTDGHGWPRNFFN